MIMELPQFFNASKVGVIMRIVSCDNHIKYVTPYARKKLQVYDEPRRLRGNVDGQEKIYEIWKEPVDYWKCCLCDTPECWKTEDGVRKHTRTRHATRETTSRLMVTKQLLSKEKVALCERRAWQ